MERPLYERHEIVTIKDFCRYKEVRVHSAKPQETIVQIPIEWYQAHTRSAAQEVAVGGQAREDVTSAWGGIVGAQFPKFGTNAEKRVPIFQVLAVGGVQPQDTQVGYHRDH